MFVASEADAAAIRSAFQRGGELSGAVELRRLFPGITNNAMARVYARTIAGWQPRPEPAGPVTSLNTERETPREQRALTDLRSPPEATSDIRMTPFLQSSEQNSRNS